TRSVPLACCFAPETQTNNPAEGDPVKPMTGPAYFTRFKNLEFNRAPRAHSPRIRLNAWGAVAEVLPLEQVLPRAQEIAETLAARPQLLTRHPTVTQRQRISRRMAEGIQLGMAPEGLTAANLAYQG